MNEEYFTEDPWKSARDEFSNVILPKLRLIGKEIGKQSDDGNKLASKVISAYALLYKSFDPMSLILLEEAIKEYEKSLKSTG